MGYSVAVPIRSYDLRDKMVRLLNREFKTWAELHGGTKDDPAYFSDPAKHGLSYHHGRCYIGCDYNAHGGERMYLYALIYWLAIKIGRRTPFTKSPFYIYDGHEAFGIAVDCDHTPKGCGVSDRWGVPIETKDSHKVKGMWEKLYELTHIDEEPDALDVIRAEMQRLNALWEAEG